MSEQLPDVSDPDIREMVLSNHRPYEAWKTDDPKQGSELLGVICATCRKDWPCPSIQAAREAKASRERTVAPS
jgi:hypothetical protein